MQPTNNDLFYSRLPVNEIPLTDLLMEEHLFFRVPPSWQVLITDVTNSTKAIEEGMHETINLIATGSIVAVLNLAFKANITVPFFFGGDGATFIIPPTLLEAAMQSLLLHRDNTKESFGMELRAGHVSVSDIYEQQHTLNICKLRAAPHFYIPVLLGEGLAYAEKLIKGPDYIFANLPEVHDELNLEGMQCRWDRIKPPEENDEVVSLLVLARGEARQAMAFRKVVDCIDEIYGQLPKRTPISVGKLKLNTTLGRIGVEMKTRMGRFMPFHIVSNWIKVLLGYFYFKTKKGQDYLHSLVDRSDTLVIDGRINTVISGTAKQRIALEASLNKIETEGFIYYGLYVSKESVMSCYVRDLNEDHIHFVDGAEGGYTRAARIIKNKLAADHSSPE